MQPHNVKYYTPKNWSPVPQGLSQLTPPAAEISTFRGKGPRRPQLIALKCDVLSGLSTRWDLKPVYSTVSGKGWGEILAPKVDESSKRVLQRDPKRRQHETSLPVCFFPSEPLADIVASFAFQWGFSLSSSSGTFQISSQWECLGISLQGVNSYRALSFSSLQVALVNLASTYNPT